LRDKYLSHKEIEDLPGEDQKQGEENDAEKKKQLRIRNSSLKRKESRVKHQSVL